ncbi:MAG: pyrroline-5-carboxylate reductase [Betaproteobacteria bacterium RIFCSPLOWO2_12_FULL_62_58]|nr:MAG: pyrroline-5-carboxylate reductase [Betaproteobacteria bacterium RIFCSPLOWO2_02_FULL_62_79]OGA54251.1 MAG: pyrroline-5-carboxylate reductase [Betaproteobacteria bacterium RIFCSPLOWO2_12_FULL_62_58]
MNVTFIGGGNMAAAMIGGLLQKGWPANAIRVVEIDDAARTRLARELRIRTYAAADAEATAADSIVLAVKPQQMREAARALRPAIRSQLVITIAAGIRCQDLSRWLGGYTRIVRVMPNTPALVLAGISGLYAMPALAAADRTLAETIMSAVGATLWLEREAQIDAITAVSGSGPAYVFYFIEALQQAAADLGFNTADARRLALETFAGAVRLAQTSGEEPATLRARVTSKGGTTERALGVMDEQALKNIVIRAVRAAAERSHELGEELGGD